MARGSLTKVLPDLIARLRPEIFFLVLALAAGSAMVFITAPFQAPDESVHFFRAYQISEGNLRGAKYGGLAGGPLPEAVVMTAKRFQEPAFHPDKKADRQAVKESLKEPMEMGRRIFVKFPNTVINAPLCYTPQALGIALGRFCGLPVLGMMYAGRLFSLLCWIALVFAAIRTTPAFKWIIAMVGLMPMTIFLAASLSADTMINACALLLAAIILRVRFSQGVLMASKTLAIIAALCIAISLMKFVYVPLVGLIFLIPPKYWGGQKKMFILCSAIITACVVAVLLWSIETKRVYVPLYGSFMPDQIVYILTNPLRYIVILLKSTVHFLHSFVSTFTGVLGWLDTKLPDWVYYTYTPVLLALAINERTEENSFPLPARIWLALCCCASYLLIATAQYLTMNLVASQLLIGVVGRYFIPLAVPALAAVSGIFAMKRKNILIGTACVYSICVLASMLITLYHRYW